MKARRHYRPAAPSSIDGDQRKRLERDLAAETKRAAAERAVAANIRRFDNDEESAQAADERARDADEQITSIRTVLARFPAKPNYARARSFRR